MYDDYEESNPYEDYEEPNPYYNSSDEEDEHFDEDYLRFVQVIEY